MKVLVGLAVFFLLAACCSAQDENGTSELQLGGAWKLATVYMARYSQL